MQTVSGSMLQMFPSVVSLFQWHGSRVPSCIYCLDVHVVVRTSIWSGANCQTRVCCSCVPEQTFVRHCGVGASPPAVPKRCLRCRADECLTPLLLDQTITL
eukprot:gene8371-biopygen21146